jgi:hypothetical protein
MHQCIVIVDIDNLFGDLDASAVGNKLVHSSTSDNVLLTNCFSVDIPKISMTSEVRPTKSVPWSDRYGSNFRENGVRCDGFVASESIMG